MIAFTETLYHQAMPHISISGSIPNGIFGTESATDGRDAAGMVFRLHMKASAAEFGVENTLVGNFDVLLRLSKAFD